MGRLPACNGRTTPEPSIDKATLPDVAEKGVSSLIKADGIGDLYRLYAISKRDGIDYDYIEIPADFTVEAKKPVRQQVHACVVRRGL
ncbi:hypothetical protein [Ensifer sesbaniae]|uniref:hypothetical protein n=1 Tax=Ensifer sesbaniae TaxID=1214071 RepID=UPI001569FACD|nr:hypothetical protein [Ensifer sesbaniae]NRQ12821.1 hypothetical protein [Ensifer sesbaniae]